MCVCLVQYVVPWDKKKSLSRMDLRTKTSYGLRPWTCFLLKRDLLQPPVCDAVPPKVSNSYIYRFIGLRKKATAGVTGPTRQG